MCTLLFLVFAIVHLFFTDLKALYSSSNYNSALTYCKALAHALLLMGTISGTLHLLFTGCYLFDIPQQDGNHS